VRHPHTIADGISLLFQHGYWPVGILICFTSVGIPFGKLIVLGWFCVSVERGSKRWLGFRTSLYRVVDEIGRWSNLDPFTVVIFTPMVQFPGMAFIQVGGGAPIFMTVVVLSMVAVRVFDPRLMWDAAGYGRSVAKTDRISEYAAEPVGNRP
jgi:paraquat-inducible protein A